MLKGLCSYKTIRPILGALFILSCLISVPAEGLAGLPPKLVRVRTGEHSDFHRVVIELSKRAEFDIKSDNRRLSVRLKSIDASGKIDAVQKTGLIGFEGITPLADESGTPLTSLDFIISKDFSLKKTVKNSPFRIIIDITPADLKQSEAEAKAKAEKKAADKKKAEVFPTEKPDPDAVTFNDGWRWIYRKHLLSVFKSEFHQDNALKAEALRAELGLTGLEIKDLVKEADALAEELKKDGDPADAAVLEKITTFLSDEKKAHELEEYIKSKESGLGSLARFLIGNHYEKRVFLPEASGYYSRVLLEKEEGALRGIVFFQKARLLFLEGKFEEAKEGFEKALESGYMNAGPWLANTLLIKGEFEPAWELYSKNTGSRDLSSLDPITALSLADMNVIKGNYEDARGIYETLRKRYSRDEFLAAYFETKKGDVLVAEGRKFEAVRHYSKAKERLKGEAWALAAISLADALSKNTDTESLEKAEKLYHSVVEGGHLSSEIAVINLVSAHASLNKYEEGLRLIEAFPVEYPTSPLRPDVLALKGKLVYKWIDWLSKEGDSAGIVMIEAKYGSSIPFGKRGESYIKIAKAYMDAGLPSEAISTLDGAIKLGNDKIGEEAMVLLAKIYLSQKDTNAVDRALEAIKASYPKGAYSAELSLIALRNSFLKGEYRGVAGSNTADDPEALLLKAAALAELKKHAEAESVYEKASVLLKKKGEDERLREVEMKIADLNFRLERYKKAIDYYRRASFGLGETEDRAWAFYRMAQAYSRMKNENEKKEVLKELKVNGTELGGWALQVFKKAPENL